MSKTNHWFSLSKVWKVLFSTMKANHWVRGFQVKSSSDYALRKLKCRQLKDIQTGFALQKARCLHWEDEGKMAKYGEQCWRTECGNQLPNWVVRQEKRLPGPSYLTGMYNCIILPMNDPECTHAYSWHGYILEHRNGNGNLKNHTCTDDFYNLSPGYGPFTHWVSNLTQPEEKIWPSEMNTRLRVIAPLVPGRA